MAKVRRAEEGRLLFWCPGCNEAHAVIVDGSRGWSWDGSEEAPTINPSILVRGVKIEGGDAELDRILDTYKLPEDRERMLADKRINTVCHSFVRAGAIEFLSDCTHALAGQTVPLPEWGHELA